LIIVWSVVGSNDAAADPDRLAVSFLLLPSIEDECGLSVRWMR